jgi:hypothetical protein
VVVADFGKLGMLLAILLVTAGLGWAGVLDAGDVRLVLAVELGYLTGNGVLARNASAPSPVLAPRSIADPPEGT